MIKAENTKLLIDGKEVTNDYEFIADKGKMEVQIEFTFDGSNEKVTKQVVFCGMSVVEHPDVVEVVVVRV